MALHYYGWYFGLSPDHVPVVCSNISRLVAQGDRERRNAFLVVITPQTSFIYRPQTLNCQVCNLHLACVSSIYSITPIITIKSSFFYIGIARALRHHIVTPKRNQCLIIAILCVLSAVKRIRDICITFKFIDIRYTIDDIYRRWC